MRLYLDTCCLSRPWDDQSQVQVHLEAEAVLFIIEEARLGHVDLTTSDYLLAEIHDITDPQRRADVLELTRPAALHMAQTTAMECRAADFALHNIKGYDALHIAAAEAAKADYLLTTDQRLLTRAKRAGSAIQVTLPQPHQLASANPRTMTTLHEINTKAQTILRATLGPVDYARYTQQFSTGSGNYTAERQQKHEDATEVAKRVAVMKAQGKLQPPPNATVVG